MIEFLVCAYFGIHLAAQAVMERLGARAGRIANRPDPPSPAPPVTLVAPVYGADRHTEASLRSWLTQRYDGPVQHVFAAQDEADPALAILERLRAEFSFEVVVRPVRPGFTAKASNLLHGTELARHEVIVVRDHDVRAAPDTLARIVARLEDGRDVISCLPSYGNRGDLPARVYTLLWNMAIHYSWAPVTALGIVRGLWESTVALRRSTLAALGGWEELGTYLAEDLEMGRRAHRLGLRVGLGPPVECPTDTMTWSQAWRKYQLLSFIGLQQNPWGRVFNAAFFLLFYGYIPLALAAVFMGPEAAVAAGLFVVGRGLLMGRLLMLAGEPFRFPLEFPLMDVMHAAAIARVFGTKTVRWGDMVYRGERDGRIRPVP